MKLDTQTRTAPKLLHMEDLLNMQFPQFNGTLHLSYQQFASKKEFNQLVEDARKLAFKHTVKATGIDGGNIQFPDHKVYGIYYTIDGNAASSVQFFLTDSVKNYMRGALYFNSEPRIDSIQPVLRFVKQDIAVMIKSFRWK
jgi:gliding motility-associated lipoprotein GldD